jgi:Transposase IS116/IS110/IS902 family
VLLTTRRRATLARVAAVGQLKALIVAAPEELRAELRGRNAANQVQRCAALRRRPAQSLEHQATVRALWATAQRIRSLQAEAGQLQAELTTLVAAMAPWLLEVPGVGPLSATQVLVSWSHAGRLRSEAAFAALAGTNPIPAGDQLPAQPRRGPAAQPCAAHHLAGAPAHRPRHRGLHVPTHRRGQEPPRRQAVPATRHRPPAVPAAGTLRPTRRRNPPGNPDKDEVSSPVGDRSTLPY